MRPVPILLLARRGRSEVFSGDAPSDHCRLVGPRSGGACDRVWLGDGDGFAARRGRQAPHGHDLGIGYTGPLGTAAYWLEHTSLKVQPTTAPGAPGGSIELEGPRASTEAYQIALRPSGGGLRNVNALASDLVAEGGAVIGSVNLGLYREFFVDFSTIDRQKNPGGVLPAPESSPTADPRVPDPLIPLVDPYSGAPAGAPFDVRPETNQPLRSGVTGPSRGRLERS